LRRRWISTPSAEGDNDAERDNVSKREIAITGEVTGKGYED